MSKNSLMRSSSRSAFSRAMPVYLARISGEICPTYFTYEVPEYEKLKDGGIRPLKFVLKNMPYFLEGPVRYLKLPVEQGEKRALYEAVKESDLYDVHVQGECFPCGFLF